MAYIDQCQTADDVRRLNQQVIAKRRTQFAPPHSTEYEKFVLAYWQDQISGRKVEENAAAPPEQEPEPEPTPIDKIRDVQISFGMGGAPSIKTIQVMVCEVFGIRYCDLLSNGRTNVLTVPRHVSFVLARLFTNLSFPEIGRRTGNRDHSTVVHAWEKLQWMVERLKSELSVNDDLRIWVARAYELTKERRYNAPK